MTILKQFCEPEKEKYGKNEWDRALLLLVSSDNTNIQVISGHHGFKLQQCQRKQLHSAPGGRIRGHIAIQNNAVDCRGTKPNFARQQQSFVYIISKKKKIMSWHFIRI